MSFYLEGQKEFREGQKNAHPFIIPGVAYFADGSENFRISEQVSKVKNTSF
jgi:hypothetical protein